MLQQLMKNLATILYTHTMNPVMRWLHKSVSLPLQILISYVNVATRWLYVKNFAVQFLYKWSSNLPKENVQKEYILAATN